VKDAPLTRAQTDAAAQARWKLLWPTYDDTSEEDIKEVDADWEPDPKMVPDRARWRGVIDFGKEHVIVVVVALAVGVVFAVMTFLHGRADVVPLAPAVSVASSDPAPSSEPTPEAQPSPQASIKVHVMGAVAAPGVVSLTPGARVQDAIEAAGGLAAGADPAQLNLAAVVADGSQIVIGTTQHPQGQINGGGGEGSGASPAASAGKVNLNTASQVELETLPGIGPVTAQNILAWRDQHGRFTAVAELDEVSGIGPKTLAQLEPYVCI